MIRNYFKIAFRNLIKHKISTLINIGGLAIGITCCLLIFQYVAYEKSYDRFNDKAAQIVRLRLDLHDQGKLTMQSATAYPGLGTKLQKEFPEVENSCRLVNARISWLNKEMVQNNIVLANDNKNIKALENNGFYADQSFLDMFTMPLLNGDRGTSLTGPNKIILSESMAKKYFANDKVVGEQIAVREGGKVYHYEVTGVFKDYPSNAHLSFDYLISFPTFVNMIRDLGAPKWLDPETSMAWYDFYDYLQLRAGTDHQKFEAKLLSFSEHFLNNEYTRANNNRQDLYITPLTDIHLYSHYNEEAAVNADGKSVSFLFLIAFLIVIIAWINYTNLATARSLERAREVGVRKVLGAKRKNLIAQFLAESFILNFTAIVLAISLAFVLTPAFNQLTGSTSTHNFKLPLVYWEGFALLFLGGAFASGIYPAFVLSGFQPISVLKGLLKNSASGITIRKGMIVGQFATSIILIAGTIIIYQQVNFMKNQNLGADIKQTLVLEGPSEQQDSSYQNSYQAFKNEVLQVSGIKSITASSGVMGKEIYMTNGAYLLNAKNKNPRTFYSLYVDNDFLSSYDLNFVAGTNFSIDEPGDKKAVILSEEAVKLFDIQDPQKIIGQTISNYRDSLKVIGVVANYHQLGLTKEMLPVMFIPKPAINNFYSLKLQTANAHPAIASVEKVWNKYFPEHPFSFFFLDDLYNAQYKSDTQFGKVFGLFSLIAIAIACFGLLSLSAFNVLQRTKEIGIRKVLGATVLNIIYLLSKDFLILLAIAFLVAVPVTWFAMNHWLHDFAYRIQISSWIFLFAGITVILIALATISVQAIKAAIANPVKSLRTE